MAYWYLAGAIVAEVIATTALKATQEFTRAGPTVLVVSGYALAFYLLTLVLRTMPLGIAYALWSGLGMVLVTVLGVVVYRQTLDAAALVGIALIIAGALVIHLGSDVIGH